MTLLVDGMTDVTFTVKDVIYIISIVVTILLGWFKIQRSTEKTDFSLKQVEKDNSSKKTICDEAIISAKRGRHAMKAELTEKIKEVDNHARARIDKMQDENKKYQEKTDNEFRDINNSINDVKLDTSAINGKLDILINQGNK